MTNGLVSSNVRLEKANGEPFVDGLNSETLGLESKTSDNLSPTS